MRAIGPTVALDEFILHFVFERICSVVCELRWNIIK